MNKKYKISGAFIKEVGKTCKILDKIAKETGIEMRIEKCTIVGYLKWITDAEDRREAVAKAEKMFHEIRQNYGVDMGWLTVVDADT